MITITLDNREETLIRALLSTMIRSDFVLSLQQERTEVARAILHRIREASLAQ